MSHVFPRIFMILAAAAVLTASVSAGPPRSRNAAIRYERAIEHLETLSDADWEIIYEYYGNPAAPMPPGVERLRGRVTRTVDAAVRGSRLSISRYDLDFSEGAAMLLPHLGPMRSLAKLMRHDVMVRLNAGDTQGAAERLAAMYRMSRHPPDDGTMISSLVGMAMFDLADETTQIAIEQGMLGDREYGVLLDATEALGEGAAFRIMGAIEGERRMGSEWLRGFQSGEGREELAKAFEWAGELPEMDALLAMSEDEYGAALDEHDETLGRIEAAFADPDQEAARAALAEVERQIEDGEVGPLARMLLPSFSKAYERDLMTRTRLATRRRQLADLATGRSDARRLINAAYLYQRAVVALGRIDPELLETLRAHARGDETDADIVRRALDAAAPILATLDEASRIDRCEFEAVRPYWEEGRLFATPIVGMADAGALLIADALAPPSDERGEPEHREDRLATCFRMAGHLARDDAVLASVVSQALFQRGVEAAVEHVGPEQARGLVEAAGRLSPTDAFGYRRSLAAATRAATRWVATHVTPPEPPAVHLPSTTQPAGDADAGEVAAAAGRERKRIADFWADIEARVAALDGDEILCLLALREHEAVVDPPVPPEWGLRPFPGDPLTSLAEVIARAEYDEIAARAEEITTLVQHKAFGLLFAAQPAPKPARIVERSARARADLRAGLRDLGALAGTPPPDGGDR